MENQNRDCIVKSITITKKLYAPDGTERKTYIHSISYYGRSGFEIEFILFKENGDLEKHSLSDENELIKMFDLDDRWVDEDPDPFGTIVKRNEEVFDSSGKLKKNIYEYDENGRIASVIRSDKNGKIRLDEYSYDDSGKRIKTKIIDSNGDEKVTRQFYEEGTGSWQASTTELNGDLISYTMNMSGDKTVEVIYKGDKTLRIEHRHDPLGLTFESSEYENEVIMKKHITFYLIKNLYLEKESTFERIDDQLKLVEESIYEYDFFRSKA